MTEYRLRVPGEGNGGQAHWVAVHLPECPQNHPGDINAGVCACPALRACEARITRIMAANVSATWEAGYRDTGAAYYSGLDAARAAVVPWLPHAANCNVRHYEGVCDCECAPILAAIDALRDHAPTATAQDIADDRAEHVGRDER